MIRHNGMRPQDVAILIKIAVSETSIWKLTDLSHSLCISSAEVHQSLNRSRIAGLVDHAKKNVNRLNFMDFLQYGVKYVFPVELGSMTRGIPTAHSHPFMKKLFISDTNYVWADPKGDVLGLAVEPLYANLPQAAKTDETFYKALALIDALRVGRVREQKVATQELRKMIVDGRKS